MTAYQLDTNALLRYLANDIPSQSKKINSLISSARKGQVLLYVCEPIFIETAVMLRNYYKYSRDKVFSLLSDLLASQELEIENRDQLSQANALYHEASVDFTDCVLVVRAQRLNHKIFTFDRKLTQLASN